MQRVLTVNKVDRKLGFKNFLQENDHRSPHILLQISLPLSFFLISIFLQKIVPSVSNVLNMLREQEWNFLSVKSFHFFAEVIVPNFLYDISLHHSQ